jgi:lipoprotein-anchoring transpeptidase ErfK/SrfK
MAAACACGGTHEPTVARVDTTPVPQVAPAAAAAKPAVVEPDEEVPLPPEESPPKTSALGDGLASLVIKDDERIRAEPKSGAEEVGSLRAGTRVGVRSLGAQTSDCRWYEIEPYGWICARGDGSPLAPTADNYPPMWIRGYDGRVFRDADDVRANGGYVPDDAPAVVRPTPDEKELKIDGKAYLQTAGGELVPDAAVPKYWGSEFAGVTLSDDSSTHLPIGWTWFHETWKKPTPVYAEPSHKAKVVRGLPLRSRFDVKEEKDGWVRIADGEWLSREDIRIARTTEPPPEVTGDQEVWVDVNQAEQTLVLYRGKQPIRATLVSTGRPAYGTPTGIFHVKRKTAVTKFDSPRPDLVDYHIDDVAWVMHITDIFALHGAWWNRGFGAPISLGCIDIPAADIRVVYQNVEPKVPPG